MKRFFYAVLILSGLGGLGLAILKFGFAKSDSEPGHISNVIFNNNTFELNCKGIDFTKVNVTWKPDEKVSDTVIVRGGVIVHKVGYEYGPNRFFIYADGKKFVTGHLKLRDWDAHDYKIDIEKDSAGYKLAFIADGQDYAHAEHHFDRDGKLNGVQTFYHKNGKPESRETWLHGKKNGKSFEYDENGNISREEEFVNGVEKPN